MASILRRRSVRIVAGLLAMVVVIVVAAPLLVPAGRVRDLIVREIENSTGARVRLGEASVRVWPRLRVVLGEGAIDGTGEDVQRATGAANPLRSFSVALERLDVDVALWPLLKKQIKTGKVRLIGPRIELVTLAPPEAEGDAARTPGGETSRTDSPRRSDGTAPPLAWGLAVAGIEIGDGALVWRQEGSGREVSLSGWRQEVVIGDLGLLISRLMAFSAGTRPESDRTEPSRLGLTARLATFTMRTKNAPPLSLEDLQLEGDLSVTPTADRIEIDLTRLAWRDARASAVLRLDAPGPAAAGLRGEWRLDPVQLPDMWEDVLALRPLADGALKPWLEAKPLQAGRLTLEGKLELPWPLPTPLAPELVVRAIQIDGELTGALLRLPDERGEVGLDAKLQVAAGTARLSAVSIRETGGLFSLNGEITAPLPQIAGSLHASLTGEADLQGLQRLAPELSASAAASGTDRTTELAGRLAWTLEANVIDPPQYGRNEVWRARWQSGGLQGIDLEAKLEGARLAGLMPGPAWECAEMTLTSDLRTASFVCRGLAHPAVTADLSGRLTSLVPQPTGHVDFTVQKLDVDRWTAILDRDKKTAALGEASRWGDLLNGLVAMALAAAPEEPGAKPPGEILPANLHLTYAGRAETVVLQKARYDDVRWEGQLIEKVFEFPKVSARRATGVLAGDGRLDYQTDPYGALSFAVEAREVPATALLEPYIPNLAPLWQGKVSAAIKGGCRLRDQMTVLASLALDGDAISSDGTIEATSLLASVKPYLGDRQDLTVIRFKQFFHHLEVREGRYHVKDLKIDGLDTDWWGDGWLSFDGGIDMRLGVKLPPGFQPQMGELNVLADGLRGADGRIELAMRLSGRATSPKVELDLSAAKERTQQKLEEGVQKGVKGLLDKLKGK